MRRSAIPLVFFVIMCSLNILLAGCGANLPVSKSVTTPTSKTASLTKATAGSECGSCQAHQLASLTSFAPMVTAFQSNPENFPPTQSLVDSKVLAALEEQEIDTSAYSRSGNVITMTYSNNAKLTVTIDELGRVKEVKKIDSSNNTVVKFSQTYGSFSAPLSANNLMAGSPAVLATVNYNSNQQLYSVTDNVNTQTHTLPQPISPYPPLLYTVPPPAESLHMPVDAMDEEPSAELQACWDACGAAYEAAKENAYSNLAIATAAALAAYVAALFVCLGSAVFYPVCAAGFFAVYAAAVAAATAAWIAELQVAQDNYRNCLNSCSNSHGYPLDSWRRHIMFPALIEDPWSNNTSNDDLN